jgi:hypothetical protein
MRKAFAAGLLALGTFALAACGSSPTEPTSTPGTTGRFGTIIVAVTISNTQGCTGTMPPLSLYVDGEQKSAVLGSGEYRFDLPPGKHTVGFFPAGGVLEAVVPEGGTTTVKLGFGWTCPH